MQTSIRPTTTQRVRDFLLAEGVAAQPWSSLDDTYAALYGLMRARKDDERFWKPLGGLLRQIVADAAEGPRRLPAPLAETLKTWDVEGLVRDLRRALPGEGEDAAGGYRRLCSALGAPVLGGFLALGLTAAGCDMAPGEGGDDPPAWAEGCGLDASSEIYDAIDGADGLGDTEKSGLCTCLAAMQTEWQENLSAVFADCEPEKVVLALEDFAVQCEGGGGALSENPADDADSWCYGEPAYKGVCFPSKRS
jgi:hypothetical protein